MRGFVVVFALLLLLLLVTGGKQSIRLLQPSRVELGLQVGGDFDKMLRVGSGCQGYVLRLAGICAKLESELCFVISKRHHHVLQ